MGQRHTWRLIERVPRLRGIGVPEPESAAMDIVGTGLG